MLEDLQIKMSCFSVSELLMMDSAYFFTNLFAKIRFFNSGLSSKHILLTIESLKVESPGLLTLNLVELCLLIGE